MLGRLMRTHHPTCAPRLRKLRLTAGLGGTRSFLPDESEGSNVAVDCRCISPRYRMQAGPVAGEEVPAAGGLRWTCGIGLEVHPRLRKRM